jgi:hypothetical protein
MLTRHRINVGVRKKEMYYPVLELRNERGAFYLFLSIMQYRIKLVLLELSL